MPTAGDLKDRYIFQRRIAGAIADGFDRPGGWGTTAPDAFTCSAATLYLRGSDAVQASRLQGQQPAVLTIRRCAAAVAVDNTWRAVDASNPSRVFAVISAAPNLDRAFIDVLVTERKGDADG